MVDDSRQDDPGQEVVRPDDIAPRPAGWLLAALLLAAVALRFHQLGADLWFDEFDTLVRYARRPLGTIVTTYDSQNQHVLYSVAARIAVVLFGESAWAIRLPAALFGVASIGAAYWFGTLVTTRREALLAAALLTFSYHHVWFSQNARGYTGLLFFALLGSGLFVQLLRGAPGWGRVLAYAVTMALGVYVHMTAAFVAVAHLMVWAGHRVAARDPAARDTRPVVAIVLAGALSIALYAPVLGQVHTRLTTPMVAVSGELKWSSPLWLVSETVTGLAQGIPGGLLTLALGGLVVVAGALDYARQSRSFAAFLLLPPLLMAVAILVSGHNLWPRFFFFTAGFAALVVIRGIFALARFAPGRRRVPLATFAAALMIVAGATRVPAAWGPKQRYDAAWRYVQAERGPRDAVVTLLMSDVPFLDRPSVHELYANDPTALADIERGHARTWVIYSFPTQVAAAQPAIWERLSSEYRRVAAFAGTVREGEVVVMVKG